MELPAGYALRPYSTDEYDALIALGQVALDDMPMDAETLRRMDARRDPELPWGRPVVVHTESGELHGMAQWGQQYGTDLCYFWIAVHPEYRRQGLGNALLQNLLSECAVCQPESVHTYGLENDTGTLAFLERHGFTEISRTQRSHQPLAEFQAERFSEALEHVAAQGIVIRTLAEIVDDPQARRRLYDTENALWTDVPSPTAHVPTPFDRWEKRLMESSLKEGYFVAEDQASGAFVGISSLLPIPGGSDLQTQLTGVLPAYRRRGIALALKVRAAQYAQAAGVPTIHTGNATTNVGMLAINRRLGFQKQPARIRFRRDYGSGGLAERTENLPPVGP